MDTSSTSTDQSVDSQMDRLTVPEAADLLRVTQAAIYKRISRGTIAHDKDTAGHVYVYLDTSDIDSDMSTDKSSYRSETLGNASAALMAELKAHNQTLRDEVEAWREEARRKDHIIAGLVQRVPELEAAQEPREGPLKPSEEAAKGGTAPEQQESSQRRSWWRVFFGLE